MEDGVSYNGRMVNAVSPREALILMANGQIDVVDVRESDEWATGHVPGARHVPLSTLRANPKESLRRDGVIFVCAAGIRSATAARVAEQHGFKALYNLTGGTLGWEKAGLPIARESKAA
jgi:rhodanese-related sulfurtransferase